MTRFTPIQLANNEAAAEKKIIVGFDLLKFLMSMMIVAIHTKAFFDVDIIRRLTAPLLNAAVPVFFILSSFFLFSKMEKSGFLWCVWMSFFKRISILYLFWFIITLPVTLYTRSDYWELSQPVLALTFFKDLLFSHTFGGSWFLSALVVGVLFVFLLKKYLNANNVVLLLLAIAVYIFVKCQDFFPNWLQQPYLFLQHYIREEVELTFVTGFIWCAIGFILAKKNFLECITSRIYSKIQWFIWLGLFLLCVLIQNEFKIIVLPFFVVSMIIVAYSVKSRPTRGFLYLRNLSILIYLIHFVMLHIVSHFLPQGSLHIVYFIGVYISSLFLSMAILHIEKSPIFKVLKYAH